MCLFSQINLRVDFKMLQKKDLLKLKNWHALENGWLYDMNTKYKGFTCNGSNLKHSGVVI